MTGIFSPLVVARDLDSLRVILVSAFQSGEAEQHSDVDSRNVLLPASRRVRKVETFARREAHSCVVHRGLRNEVCKVCRLPGHGNLR